MKLTSLTTPTNPINSMRERNIICRIFFVLFFQVQLFSIASIYTQSGTVWVKRYIFGFDFYDFYAAYGAWRSGGDPYASLRFVTPPPSLLVGSLLHNYGFISARYAFAVVNILLTITAVLIVSHLFSFSKQVKMYMAGITFLYYPFLFLIDRGNLDGLVLICLAMLLISRRAWQKILWVSLAVCLKLYGLLVIAIFIRKRQWNLAIGTALTTALFLVPFHALMVHFLHNLFARGSILTGTENMSPAAIFGSFGKSFPGMICYALFWLGTLLILFLYEGNRSSNDLLFMCLPWMAALPLQVYPYTGVLLLLTCMWKLNDMQDGKSDAADGFFFLGFILVGLQAEAYTQYFHWVVRSHRFFYMLNSIGTTIILISITVSALQHGSRSRKCVPAAAAIV